MPSPSENIIHKELDLIQDIIKRMAANSFQIKAWLIGLLSAIVVFSMEKLTGIAGSFIGIFTSLLLLVPIVCFWYLDAFFLSTEKLYRELYKWVVANRPETKAYLYDLNTFTRVANGQEVNLIKPENSIWQMMKSKTLLPFYLTPLSFVFLLLVYHFSALLAIYI